MAQTSKTNVDELERDGSRMSFKDRLLSEQHTFEVGEGKTLFRIPSAMISCLSGDLEKLLNGPMREGHTKHTVLPEIDEDTFGRFCEFAYTGDYHPPDHITVNIQHQGSETTSRDQNDGGQDDHVQGRPETEYAGEDAPPAQPPVDEPAVDEVEAPAEDIDDWGWGFARRKKSKKRLTMVEEIPTLMDSRSREQFRQRTYDLTECRSLHLEDCEPSANQSEEENFSPVFLGHARIYVVADQWNVRPLKLLSLHKLHQTLLKFTVYSSRVSDVIDLIRFAYDNEYTRDDEEPLDELRELVLSYVIYERRAVTETRIFYDLLEEGGPFVRDFYKRLTRDVLG